MATILGLTGGIATGKSTVSNMIKEIGIPVIDADLAARAVVDVGEEAYQNIVNHFGKEILTEDGTINRERLGSIVFHDEKQREVLNSIVHPAVRKRMLRERDELVEEGHRAIVMDIPLLFESDLAHMVDKVIVVFTDEDIQLQRLMERNRLSEKEAKARISSQIPITEKISLADAVINNNGSINETKRQLMHILETWNIV